MDLIVLGISSGIGVSLFPFKDCLVGNIENRSLFHTKKNEQWKANFGKIPLDRSIFREFPKVDAIISSPDCGSGSVLRYSRAKKLGDHTKNDSLGLFFDGIKHYKPKFFLFENLEGLFKSFPENKFRKKLQNYELILHNASVAFWGNSQIYRKRLIIVGIRKDLVEKSPKLIKAFKKPDLREHNKTCKELYGDLGFEQNWESGHVREDITSVISIYGGKKLSLQEIRQWWLENPKAKRWVVEDRKYSRAPGVYRNLKNDYPATARKANRQYDHYGLTLTPRQLARIQGVPDSFKLYIDPDNKNYWINKARTAVTKTPPYEISLWFRMKLEKIYNLGLV